MKIHVIGSSGSEVPGRNLPAFLVDDFLLLDAGTIGLALNKKAEEKITHLLITHAHLDHIKGIPFFVDNLVSNRFRHPVTLMSGRDVLSDIRKNIFNNRIWPDFASIPDKKNPVIRYKAVPMHGHAIIGKYKVHAVRVTHSVPAYGYIIEDDRGKALVYTGDTGPTDRLWKVMGSYNVKVLIIETSFPDSMRDLAIKTGHLTPSLLAEEIGKMKKLPEEIYVTHAKPQYMSVIESELGNIKDPYVTVLGDNTVISV